MNTTAVHLLQRLSTQTTPPLGLEVDAPAAPLGLVLLAKLAVGIELCDEFLPGVPLLGGEVFQYQLDATPLLVRAFRAVGP